MSKATAGEELLGALIHHNDLSHLIELPDFASMLSDHEKEAWDYISGFVTQHKAFPKIETIEMETGVILPEVVEVPSYYAEHLRKRWVSQKIKEATAAAKGHLPLTKEANPDAAFTAMQDVLMEVHTRANSGQLFDARYLVDPVMKQHTLASPGMFEGIEFGWPYLDDQCGGLRGNDLVSYVGRPAHGKTWQLLWGARHAWKNQKKKVMFVSMEMEPIQILTRLASLEAGVENKIIKGGEMSDAQKGKVYALKSLEGHGSPFWVVDGALSVSVDGILMLARTLNPDVIYIDGAYLVRHPNGNLNTYQRVAAVCEQIKMDLASGLNIPVVASWQFNREASKKKKDETIGLEDIAYSDVIGQLSSVVIGLFEGDTIESQQRKRIDLLKGRGGEQGEFYTNWRFKTGRGIGTDGKDKLLPPMDFSQWDDSADDLNMEEVQSVDDFQHGG